MTRALLVLACLFLPAYGGDWSKRLSADYLDSRQKAWAEWPRAAAPGGTCVSCHTGLSYMLARPALARALGETGPSPYETGLLAGIRSRLKKQEPGGMFAHFTKEPLLSQAAAVEAVIAAVLLAPEMARGESHEDADRAFERMWSLQLREGKAKGSWAWFSLGLSPWECAESNFYGAALAAQALGSTPAGYRNRPEVRDRSAALFEYLRREYAAQPLHNRIALLWMSGGLPDAAPESMRQQTVEEVWSKQGADGSWTVEALGPWTSHARSSEGADSYATALAALALQKAGTPRSDPKLARALAWLRAHQDRQTGSWAAESMNKEYPPDSMQVRFMSDAATAYAVLALLDGEGR